MPTAGSVHAPTAAGRMHPRGRTLALAAAKSSGVTWSRNSLNFSTTSSVSSTSCSNSIAESAITSSAAKIGAPTRTASAIASLGRESISSSRPGDLQRDLGEEGVVAQLGHRDLRAADVELAEHVAEQVVRHRPRRRRALQLHQDRRRLGVADPDRQELVAVGGLEQHDRLLADHVEADAVDDHLLHWALPGRGPLKYRSRPSGLARARRARRGVQRQHAGERRAARSSTTCSTSAYGSAVDADVVGAAARARRPPRTRRPPPAATG